MGLGRESRRDARAGQRFAASPRDTRDTVGERDPVAGAVVARLSAYRHAAPRDPAFTAHLRAELMRAHGQRREQGEQHSRPRAVARVSWRVALTAAALSFGGGVAAARVLPAGSGAGSHAATRAVSVDQNPSRIVVDARTGHTFVVSGGSYADTSSGGSVSTLDTRTGALLRTALVEQGPIDAAVGAAGRLFVVNSYWMRAETGTVSVLDAASGHILRTVKVGGVPTSVAADVSVGDGKMFVLNALNGGVSVLDATTGALLHTIPLPAHNYPLVSPDTLAIDARRGRGFAVIANDTTRTGHIDDALVVFDTRRDVVVRTIPLGQSMGGVVVDEQTGRAFLSGYNTVRVFDTRDGRALRVLAIATPNATMLVDRRHGQVFVAHRNRVSVLDARDGRVLRDIVVNPLGYDVTPRAIDEKSGRVLVTYYGPLDRRLRHNSDGSMYLLDGAGGAVLRALASGASVTAVDEQTGRAFIATAAGVIGTFDIRH